ncbi:MAG: TonB family protein / TonB-dependent receptor [Labilithrix sp.]|nr:TonB family protein / TonB-dependent receptor [Labilithrix sp.]
MASSRVRRAAVLALALSAASSTAAADEPPAAPVAPVAHAEDAPIGPPPAPTDLVQVRGRKGAKSGQTTFSAAEVREVPGAFGDPFRVMEALPGVTPMVSGLPFFFVRGAPPGNNGYYLDGVRVPLLYHVGVGPSVIHPGMVEKVDFWPGGYPARFGRFAGGILAGETRRPADEVHGEGNIRLFDAGALVEAPFADGKGSVLLAGRYSYTAAIISLAAPDAVLDYWDYQARIAYRLGDKDAISVFAFGSYDFFGEKQSNGETRTAFATQFHRIDARWDHELPHGGKLRAAVTVGQDQTGTEDLAGVRDRMLTSRVYLEQPVGRDVLVRAGVDATLDHYALDSARHEDDREEQQRLYPPRNDLAVGMHLDAVFVPTDRWEVTPGVRLDLFESVRASAASSPRGSNGNGAVPAVDPRLLSRLRITKDVAFVSTFGISHQPPAFFIPIPGLQLGRLDQGLQTSIQTSQGLDIALPLAFTLTPTFFYHRYLGLSDFATTCGISDGSATGDNDSDNCLDKRVTGRTYGAELMLKRSLTKKLTGWLSYTLSRTTRTTQTSTYAVEDLLAARRGPRHTTTEEIAGDFDRTHVLNVIGAYDLGHGWRAGGRFYYYTGRPYSATAYGVPLPPFNERRYPDFYRIDARLEKAWHVGKKGRISLVLEWLNVTLRKEATSVSCGSSSSGGSVQQVLAAANECTFEYVGPVTIPSIGVEGAF